MKEYKGIIFDLDGVICHTDRYHYQAWKELADSLGIYFDKAINERLRGVSRSESLDIILENSDRTFSQKEKEFLTEKKNDIYRKQLEQMTAEDLPREVSEMLDSLREKGLKLAIGSSSKNTKLILERIGLGSFFDAVSDGTNIVRSKPDPEVFLKAARMLGLRPWDCLVVEDAEAGIEAAVRGGFDSAGLFPASQNGKVTYPLNDISDMVGILTQTGEEQ